MLFVSSQVSSAGAGLALQSVILSRKYLGRDQVAARLRRHGLGGPKHQPQPGRPSTRRPAPEVG